MFNPIRIKYIIDKCSSHFNLEKKGKEPLSTLKVLDIGCGGGLVCEPLSRLGASVTGIDASSKNIEVAKIHARKSNLKIKYINTSPEKKEIKEKFDVILNLEIIEHGIAVDEVTAAEGHWGGVIAALILPDSLGIGGPVGRVREMSSSSTGLRSASDGGGNFSL